MAGVVIDISTGKVIERLNEEVDQKRSSSSERSVLEISAPDGRKVFSINRASHNSTQRDSKESFAA